MKCKISNCLRPPRSAGTITALAWRLCDVPTTSGSYTAFNRNLPVPWVPDVGPEPLRRLSLHFLFLLRWIRFPNDT